jgi:hypothetical protein
MITGFMRWIRGDAPTVARGGGGWWTVHELVTGLYQQHASEAETNPLSDAFRKVCAIAEPAG